MSGRVYNLLGTEYDTDWLMEHIDQLIPFDEAAKRVNSRWTHHYLHKHVTLGRISKRNVVILEDEELIAVAKGAWNSGKKYFILEEELDKLVEWYLDKQTPRAKGVKCRFCGRNGKACIENPCQDRIKAPERTKLSERITRLAGRAK